MYDDILGPYEEKKEKKPKKRINLKNQVCYDCGNTFEECECEEGFSLEDLDLDEEESKLGAIDENDVDEDPWDGADMEDTCKDDCGDDDCGCLGVGCLDDGISPEQDIASLSYNDEGRNCEGQCKTCEMYDCMYQYLD